MGESQVGTTERGGAILVLAEKRSEYNHEQGIQHYDRLGDHLVLVRWTRWLLLVGCKRRWDLR